MTDASLTLKQLRVLLAIRDKRHFRHAAEDLGVTQPALSAQLKNLEEIVGVQLVERSRSGVSLTPIGREVAARSAHILHDAQAILDIAASARDGLAGTIRMGTTSTLGPYLLPQVVAKIYKQYKELHLFIHESLPRDLEHELNSGQHDLILYAITQSERR